MHEVILFPIHSSLTNTDSNIFRADWFKLSALNDRWYDIQYLYTYAIYISAPNITDIDGFFFRKQI